MRQQGATDAGAAVLREHEQILEPESAPAFPGREGVKEDCEADRASVELCYYGFGIGLWAEQAVGQQFCRAADVLGRSLVLGELPDQREDRSDVVGRGRPNLNPRAQSDFGRSSSRLRIFPVGPFGRSSTNQIRRGYL